MKPPKLSHIAIAAPNLLAASEKFQKLSFKMTSQKEVPSEKVKTGFLPIAASTHLTIELLEPASEESPISKFLEKKPSGGLHHLCFEVDKIEEWYQFLIRENIEVLKPGIRVSAHGRALFIHPKEMAGVLLELEEIHHP